MSWVTAGHEIESEDGLLFLHVQTSLSITKEYVLNNFLQSQIHQL